MISPYLVPEPFDKALKLLRDALTKANLHVAVELDVSGRIKSELGISLAPCRMLLVDCPFILLEAIALDGSAAALLPLHIVVIGRGPRTAVNLFWPASQDSFNLPGDITAPVIKLQNRVSRALDKVAIRGDLCRAAS